MFWNKRSFWIKIYNLRTKVNEYKNFLSKLEIENTAKSVGKNLYIGGYSRVTIHTELGDNVSFNGMKITGSGNVKIGRNFRSGINCLIITQSHNYDEGTKLPYDDKKISKDVSIGDYVWFGSNVTILPGTVVEDGAIIQAGSVCHGLIPKCSIVGGNPAKVFKYRNINHYNEVIKKIDN